MIACGDVRACSRDEVVQGMEGLRERQFPFTHLFFSFFFFSSRLISDISTCGEDTDAQTILQHLLQVLATITPEQCHW